MVVDGVYDGCLGVQVISHPNFLWREMLCIGSDAPCPVVISCFIVTIPVPVSCSCFCGCPLPGRLLQRVHAVVPSVASTLINEMPSFSRLFFFLPQHPTLFSSARVQFILVICKDTLALPIFIPPSCLWSHPNTSLWDHSHLSRPLPAPPSSRYAT